MPPYGRNFRGAVSHPFLQLNLELLNALSIDSWYMDPLHVLTESSATFSSADLSILCHHPSPVQHFGQSPLSFSKCVRDILADLCW